MKTGFQIKQILLFLLTVILPSLVLVVFAIRMISQEQELAQKRTAEERSRLAREIGQQLLIYLEEIKVQEANAVLSGVRIIGRGLLDNPEVVLVCRVEEQRLVLPWEDLGNNDVSRFLSEHTEFSQQIQLAEQIEFTERNPDRAAELYRQAVNAAAEPVQKEYARLLLARTLMKSGENAEAIEHYRRMLALPSGISDEFGVPLAFYAASRMIDEGVGFDVVAERVQLELDARPLLSPSAVYMLEDLIEKFGSMSSDSSVREASISCRSAIRERISIIEGAAELQLNFQGLGLTNADGDDDLGRKPLWIAFGERPWLVSVVHSLGDRPSLAVAVDALDLLVALKSDTDFMNMYPMGFDLVSDPDAGGESLGPSFRNLRVLIRDADIAALKQQLGSQPTFYYLALVVILSVTFFGAYLLWRDMRREIQISEMRSQFVSSVSHELKTPLAAIQIFAETLQLGRTKDAGTQREYLDTIVKESQRLARLLNNVLDFSRIEQGKRVYRRAKNSLYEIINASARVMEYHLHQQGFELRIQLEEDISDAYVDRDAIEQAILNLLHNAMKYSGDSRDIDLRLLKKDGFALIQVTDRGIGIAPAEHKLIFDRFYRVSSAENRNVVGTGLGLYIVSHIVEAHGGHMNVESALGKGSTFSIYLPLTRES